METSDIIIVVVLSIIEVALLVFLIAMIRVHLLWEFKYSTPEERAKEREEDERKRYWKRINKRRHKSAYSDMPGEFWLPWNQEKKKRWEEKNL